MLPALTTSGLTCSSQHPWCLIGCANACCVVSGGMRGSSRASGLDPRGRNAHPSEFIKSSRHLGFDIGKNTLHLVGLDGRGAIVLRRLATAPAAVSSWWPAVARTTSPARSEQA